MQSGTIESFKFILQKSVEINVITTGVPVDNYSALCHSFYTKNLLTAISIDRIIHPSSTIIKNHKLIEIDFYDPMSALTIVRSLFESYVNMYYLLVDNISEDEKLFKFLLWERFWRSERKTMAELLKSQNIKLDKENQEIVEIEKELFSSKFYESLSIKLQQFYVDRKNWTNLNFIDRAKRTNINSERVQYMYKYLSQYTHSNSFALMQFSSVDKNDGAISGLNSIASCYTELLLSLTLDILSDYFEQVKKIIDGELSLGKTIIDWKQYVAKSRK
ncbi:MAG: DUF5677 domain-containing protein [Bacteroidales bacterium]|nr:DUF5677 domain-containing protein [Bacteroidales bacterium]